MRRRPSPAFVLAFLALLASMSGVGIAAIPARDGDIHICYSKKTGQVEVVDTQSDQFDCEKNWAGFAIDTKPTQLVSPNGKFKVEVTDTGARMIGPDAQVEVGAGTVTVDGQKGVKVRSGGTLDVTSGDDLKVTGGKDITVEGGGAFALSAGKTIDLRSAADIRLTASKRLAGTGGTAVSLTGQDAVDVTSGKTLDLTGGSDVGLTGGKKVGVRAGTDLALTGGKTAALTGDDMVVTAPKTMKVVVGKTLDVTPGDAFSLRTKKIDVESFQDTTLKAKNFTVTASGKINMKATGDVSIKGSKVKTNR